MKNPFEKENHTLLIASLAAGALVATGIAYLFLTDDGGEILSKVSGKIKEAAKDVASGIISDKTGISKKTVKTVADHAV
jgi:hypothetical protein